MNQKKKVVIIAGPTAVGKTDLCIRLAQKFNAEIFSFDSRQFYRELNIGTAKPTPDELAAVKHHFINNKSIEDDYTVSDFEKEILDKLEAYFERKDLAILTGGSGLFAKAITHGFDPIPEIDSSIRNQIEENLETHGLTFLVNQLKDLDPEYCSTADLSNTQRVVRALEVSLSTGKPFSEWHSQQAKERPFEMLKIGLERPREELYQRINKRVDLMMEQGLLNEVKSVSAFRSKNALQTVGYKELFLSLDGDINLEEAIELLKRNTRRYAKRQLTWFRNQDKYSWHNPLNDNKIEIEIKNFLKK
ncbi:tRNA (adenosine(37)-N6)-dimethylallyltransferase MiaA [Jiulongibacter sp. NS-SX5]|uniref:tRNA (adenosine(37)-N6)-dimethylallyltransferase MiaA n=1 Tax=Jiulongibacter sp. NS-SX5 TaxID=3463854 RepID=UPI004059F94E